MQWQGRIDFHLKGNKKKLNEVLKLYWTTDYTKHDDKKKPEEDIVFTFENFIEFLYYSGDIVELDVTENFDNEKEKPVVAKKKLSIEDFVSFCTGSRHITHNLMRAKTIHFRHFVVVVNTCNITLTFSVNDRYSFQPEQFLKNAVDVIYCPPCFGKCYIPLYKLRKSLVNIWA